MRISYYGYCLQHTPSGKKYLIDLRDLAKKFVASTSQSFKSSITYHGDHLYLLPFGTGLYLFVQTRANEIIKAIEGKTLDVKDIKDKLQKSETVGFASYVFMENGYLGLASRVLSPRITPFCEMMTQVVHGYGGLDYVFLPTLITEQLPKNEVQTLSHVGAVTVEMNTASTLAQDLIKQLTNRPKETLHDIGSIEIVIRPVRKGQKSLKDDLEAISKNMADSELISLEARAKVEAADQVRDVYIVGEGAVREFLHFKKEGDLKSVIPNKTAANKKLQAKVNEFKSDANLKKDKSLPDLGINRKSPSAATLVAAQPVPTKAGAGRKRASKKISR